MSWFSLDAVKDFAERVNVKELAEKVQGALPNLEQTTSILEKLTLTTPELQEERQRLEREEQRKLQVRDTLAGLLPWETRDSERDILVDECKEAILKLSHDKNTFFGPYPIPTSTVRNLEEPTLEEAEEGIKTASHYHQQPSPESLEKLAKLEPLPILLQDFDLNAHVGLINRLLKVDKKLVEMQSTHSGGGEREWVFWRNYFFHCAYTRYEAGLSIDEIWSDNPPVFHDASAPTAIVTADDEGEEHTITFDDSHKVDHGAREKAFLSSPVTDPEAPFGKESEDSGGVAGDDSPNDFEIVADAVDKTAATDPGDSVDYELDELEAEIARELED